ncbi:MAG: transcription antitermination factor NusB [Bdellovibrionota bacterium]
MNSRHRAREVALQIIYRYDVAAAQGSTSPTAHELTHELKDHFRHFDVPDGLREFASQLVTGTVLKLPELDLLLEKHSANWRISRLGFVDRSILRMSICEMQYHPETAPTVIINEAVELAKSFGTSESPAFINGILDAIKTALGQQAIST